MFDGANQFGKNIAAVLDHAREGVERTTGLRGVAVFEFPQPIDLKLLLAARRADDFRLGGFCFRSRVAIQPDDGAGAVGDLLFVTMRGGLDL